MGVQRETSTGTAEKASQAGAHLNCILKEKEALVREDYSRREEFCEQRLGRWNFCGLLRDRRWRTRRRCGQLGIWAEGCGHCP